MVYDFINISFLGMGSYEDERRGQTRKERRRAAQTIRVPDTWNDYYIELAKFKSDFEEIHNIIKRVKDNQHDITKTDMRTLGGAFRRIRGNPRRMQIFEQIREDNRIIELALRGDGSTKAGIIPTIDKIMERIKKEKPDKNIGVAQAMVREFAELMRRDLDADLEVLMETLNRHITLERDIFDEDQKSINTIVKDLERMIVELYQILHKDLGSDLPVDEAAIYKLLEILEVFEDLRQDFDSQLLYNLRSRQEEELNVGGSKKISHGNIFAMADNYYSHYKDPIYERARKIRLEIENKEHGMASMDNLDRKELDDDWAKDFKRYFLKDTDFETLIDGNKDVDKVRKLLKDFEKSREAFISHIEKEYPETTANEIGNLVVAKEDKVGELLPYILALLGQEYMQAKIRNDQKALTLNDVDEIEKRIKRKAKEKGGLSSSQQKAAKNLLEYLIRRLDSVSTDKGSLKDFAKQQKGTYIGDKAFKEVEDKFNELVGQIEQDFRLHSNNVRSYGLPASVEALYIIVQGETKRESIANIRKKIKDDKDPSYVKRVNAALESIIASGNIVQTFYDMYNTHMTSTTAPAGDAPSTVPGGTSTGSGPTPHHSAGFIEITDSQVGELNEAIKYLIMHGVLLPDLSYNKGYGQEGGPQPNAEIEKAMKSFLQRIVGGEGGFSKQGDTYECAIFSGLCRKLDASGKGIEGNAKGADDQWNEFFRYLDKNYDEIQRGVADKLEGFFERLYDILTNKFTIV